MNPNTAATIVGVVLAAGGAAEPVLNGISGGAMTSVDWFKLAIAVGTALFGWYAKFKTKEALTPKISEPAEQIQKIASPASNAMDPNQP